MSDAELHVPAAAAWLAGLGLAPFAAGTAGVWLLDAPRHEATVFLLCAYGAVILAFVGAVHWGLALAAAPRPPGRALTASVVPALLAVFALSLPPVATLCVLALGFVGVLAADRRAAARGWAPAWYPRLRLALTVAVVGCLAAAVAGLLGRGTT